MKLMTLPVANLRYRWQCDPEGDEIKNAALLYESKLYEKYLVRYEFRMGLFLGRPKVVELWQDIQANGITDPLVVYTIDDPNVYRVDLGNQRLAIARALGIKEVKCEVY